MSKQTLKSSAETLASDGQETDSAGNAEGKSAAVSSVDDLIAAFRHGDGPDGVIEIVQRLDDAEAGLLMVQNEKFDLKVKLDGALIDLQSRDAEIADLKEKLEKAEKKAKAAKISKGESPAAPAKIGPVQERLSIADLLVAISGAQKIEILFGDGRLAVGAAPVVVEGDAWAEHMLGLKLTAPIEVHGPAHGESAYHVRGYALMLDGKQVAWAERPDPLTIGAGQKYVLSNEIFF